MTLSSKHSSQLLSAYDLAWTSPSTDCKDSMPLVGGILGLNVWVEGGDLLFLIGSPNVMDENGMQVKETDYSSTVTEFAVEMLAADSIWIPIANGDSIGGRREITLSPPVTGSRFRLCILAAEGDAAAIKNFQLYAEQSVSLEPNPKLRS